VSSRDRHDLRRSQSEARYDTVCPAKGLKKAGARIVGDLTFHADKPLLAALHPVTRRVDRVARTSNAKRIIDLTRNNQLSAIAQ
jgi:hypothetical protein